MLPVEENHCARREDEHDEPKGDEEDERRGGQRLVGQVHSERDDDKDEAEEDGGDCDAPLHHIDTPRVQSHETIFSEIVMVSAVNNSSLV